LKDNLGTDNERERLKPDIAETNAPAFDFLARPQFDAVEVFEYQIGAAAGEKAAARVVLPDGEFQRPGADGGVKLGGGPPVGVRVQNKRRDTEQREADQRLMQQPAVKAFF
jgi:hypothetical protein